jgi:hypothetical protein
MAGMTVPASNTQRTHEKRVRLPLYIPLLDSIPQFVRLFFPVFCPFGVSFNPAQAVLVYICK